MSGRFSSCREGLEMGLGEGVVAGRFLFESMEPLREPRKLILTSSLRETTLRRTEERLRGHRRHLYGKASTKA